MIAIAIDGPAGAGKSTIARRAAKELGFIYVDTGALYRTIGLAVMESGTNPDVAEDLQQLLDQTQIRITFRGDEQRVLLNDRDVSDFIRTPEASMMASKVSAIPAVRAFLLSLQRNMATENNVIMDGRDIGTVVLPDAQIKLFLTASVACRAKRRYDELIAKGMEVRLEDVQADMEKRDYNDSHRAIAPLKPAEDAQIVDTSAIGLDESIALLLEIIRSKMPKEDNA